MLYVLDAEQHWKTPQLELFDGLGSETFSPAWTASGIVEHGQVLTLNGSAWHSADDAYSACSLATILEPNVAPKYYLSPTACAGILRRAEKRGKKLPEHLQQVLMRVASMVETLRGET